jgi:hypothetical protein
VPTHYDVLGVSKTAAPETIRRAYYEQARAWHPDRFVGKPEPESQKAERAMREVNEAFRVLGDSGRRAEYNRQLAHKLTGSGRISVDEGITRIDPRLLDPEYVAARRNRQEQAISTHHSRMMNVIPWFGFLGLLLLIFVFTAYANRGGVVEPIVVPGPNVGVQANACVRLLEGPSLVEVPCDRVNDGRVIGARFPDGTCPAPLTTREISLSADTIVCLTDP